MSRAAAGTPSRSFHLDGLGGDACFDLEGFFFLECGLALMDSISAQVDPDTPHAVSRAVTQSTVSAYDRRVHLTTAVQTVAFFIGRW